MKAHFKRSMKEYEAKYLKDKNDKQNKPKIGSENQTTNKNMPKPNHSQETQMNLASSVANTPFINSTKDTKTPTKRSFPFRKRAYSNIHSEENPNLDIQSQTQTNECRQYSVKEECDIDMEDNNNQLVIDESDSIAEKQDVVTTFRNDDTKQPSTEITMNKHLDSDNDTVDEGNEEDIVVDDDVDRHPGQQLPLKRSRIISGDVPSLPSSTQNTAAKTSTYNTIPRIDILENTILEAEEESENEDENVNITQEILEDNRNCDSLVEEERNRKCNWCQRPGPCSIIMQVSEPIDGEGRKHILRDQRFQNQRDKKAFCSERCFSLYRRAAFKKNRRCEWCRRPSKHPLPVKDDKNRHFCR